jgi:hypothetical protein
MLMFKEFFRNGGSTAAERRLMTSSDLTVPSAQTELLLSQSLVDAAASIQGELLGDSSSPVAAPPLSRHERKRRRKTPVIELKTR